MQERKRLGLSQAAFAEAVGVSLSSQKRYEKGEREPDIAYLESLKRIGVDVTYVLTETWRTQDSFGADEFSLSQFGLAVAKLNDISPHEIGAIRWAVEAALSKDPKHEDRSPDECIIAFEEAFLMKVAELLAQRASMRETVPIGAYSDIDGQMLSTILEGIEIAIEKTAVKLLPSKKARAAVMLYRAFKAGGKVGSEMIEEAVLLAAD